MEVLLTGQIQAETYTEIHDTDKAYCLYHHRGVLCIHLPRYRNSGMVISIIKVPQLYDKYGYYAGPAAAYGYLPT